MINIPAAWETGSQFRDLQPNRECGVTHNAQPAIRTIQEKSIPSHSGITLSFLIHFSENGEKGAMRLIQPEFLLYTGFMRGRFGLDVSLLIIFTCRLNE